MTIGLVEALAAQSSRCGPVIHLLGHPHVTNGDEDVRLTESGMRLLAFVALNEGVIRRSIAASTLWPDIDDARAAGNLRTALWRVNSAGLRLVDSTRTSLRLAECVQVDTRLLGAWSTRIISRTLSDTDLAHPAWDIQQLDLLSGWYDEWIPLDRDRLRQRLLHALEELARALLRARRCAEAVDVGIVVVRADPLRESAQEVLIQAYLAEGNPAQARRAFDEYHACLQRELRLSPSKRLLDLVACGSVGSESSVRASR